MSNVQAPEKKEIQKLKLFLEQKRDRSNKEILEALYLSTQILKDQDYKTDQTKTITKVLLEVLDEVAVRFELNSTVGFFQNYFDMLLEYPTQLEAFNALNDEVERKTGEKRYKDFQTFRQAIGMS